MAKKLTNKYKNKALLKMIGACGWYSSSFNILDVSMGSIFQITIYQRVINHFYPLQKQAIHPNHSGISALLC